MAEYGRSKNTGEGEINQEKDDGEQGREWESRRTEHCRIVTIVYWAPLPQLIVAHDVARTNGALDKSLPLIWAGALRRFP